VSFIYPHYAEYIIITVKTVVALERAATDIYHCPITSPSHLGGGENFLSPIRITVKAVLALKRAGTFDITVRSQPTIGGGEEVIVSFLWPSLPITSALFVCNRVLNCSVFGP